MKPTKWYYGWNADGTFNPTRAAMVITGMIAGLAIMFNVLFYQIPNTFAHSDCTTTYQTTGSGPDMQTHTVTTCR